MFFEGPGRSRRPWVGIAVLAAVAIVSVIFVAGSGATLTGSTFEGNDGNMLVGWGTEPYFTEFARDGSIQFDAKLPDTSQNYRSLRFPWVGRPTEPPSSRQR